MDPRATRWAGALAALSAAAATTHEVAWARLLARVAGNTSLGVGLSLGLFLVGMGLGGLLARALLARGAGGRRGYVAAELTVAAGAAAGHAFAAYGPIPSGLLGGGLPLDVAACVLVTLPATLAIGATYPFLLAASADAPRAPRAVTALYLAGLLGGVLGVVIAGFALVPRFGADVAGFTASFVNAAVAAAASRVLARGEVERTTAASDPSSLARPLALFASAGALGLGAQIVWNRAITPYAGVSVFTFSAIVAVYLLAQSLGFFAARRLARARAGASAAALAPAVLLLSLGLAPEAVEQIPTRDGGLAWLAATLLVVLVAAGPGALLLGAIQASALAELEALRAGWARAAAVVTGLGTALSAIAGIVTSLALYGALGPRLTLAVLAIPLALVLALSSADRARAAVLAALTLFALWLSPGPAHFLGASFDRAELLMISRGAQDTAAVVLSDGPVEPRVRHLVANGVAYSGDSLFAQRYMRLLGHLPALAAARRERALVICVGTGSTAGALLSHPFDRVDAVDVSPSIEESLAHFAHVHGGLPTDRRARIIVDDGLRFLATSRERWDVITMEPPPPRAPGASSLYSLEMYELASARLTDGGAIAQWLPLHGLTSVELDAIVRTFLAVFPAASLHLVERNEAILVGRVPVDTMWRQPRERRFADRSDRDLAAIGFAGRDPIDDTRVAGPRELGRLTRGAPVIRYAWPMPELTPLHGRSGAPVDAWLERLAAASHTAEGSSAGILLGLAPSFVRVREGRARRGDRERATAGLVAWLARDPSDPYVQHAFGYGSLLEARLARVEIDDAARARVRALMARQAETARELLEGRRPR